MVALEEKDCERERELNDTRLGLHLKCENSKDSEWSGKWQVSRRFKKILLFYISKNDWLGNGHFKKINKMMFLSLPFFYLKTWVYTHTHTHTHSPHLC